MSSQVVVEDGDFSKSTKYTCDVMVEQVIKHARIGRNQICQVGNHLITAADGNRDMLDYYQAKCAAANPPVPLAAFIPSASGMWFKRRARRFVAGDLFSERCQYASASLVNWTADGCSSSLQLIAGDGDRPEKVASRALNKARRMCGTDTLMVAGTCASIGRGFSNVTETKVDGQLVVCPPTLTLVVVAAGQPAEVTSQGAQRNSCELPVFFP